MKYFFKTKSVQRPENVLSDSEKYGLRKTDDTDGNHHCSQRIKYSLPSIACGKSDSDASDDTDYTVKPGRKMRKNKEKDQSSEQIPGNTPAYMLLNICSKRKQDGHCGDSCHIALGRFKIEAIKITLETAEAIKSCQRLLEE